MKHSFLGLVLVLLFAGCTQKGKKLIIMSSGAVSETGSTITVNPGNTHTEIIQDISSQLTMLTIKGFAGASSVELPENGLYVLNLKNDTLVGSYQSFGASETTSRISQEELKRKVDSLQQLVTGQNANATNRNFFILPGKAQLITINMQAMVYGPYTKLPSSLEGGGSAPEVYKFSTNKQVRETIEKLTKMMTADE